MLKPDSAHEQNASSVFGAPETSPCENLVSAPSLNCPQHILLPSAKFLDLRFLTELVDKVHDPSVIWLVIGGCVKEQNVQDHIIEINKAVGLGGLTHAWRPVHNVVSGMLANYYISSEAGAQSNQPLQCVGDCDQKTCPSHADVLNLFAVIGLRSIVHLPVDHSQGRVYLLEKPGIFFPPIYPVQPWQQPDSINPFTTPTMAEWRKMWKSWDLITLRMIPPHLRHQKPIHLRNCCLFYFGHLPTFLDILLSKCLKEEGTEPRGFWNIFERGIDPDVDNPDLCHRHSKVPEVAEDWPSLESILAFRDRVRARIARLYEDVEAGRRIMSMTLARTLFMCFEHEGWHIETILYMVLQRSGTGMLPPPDTQPPPWELLAKEWDAIAARRCTFGRETVIIGPAKVKLGLNDLEAEDEVLGTQGIAEHAFVWDNESPERTVTIGKIKVSLTCVTNGEFMNFWLAEGKERFDLPASWVEIDGVIKVRTLFGPVAFDIARHWPVLACYDVLSAYAQAKGGRLPNEPELIHFLDLYDAGYEGGANVGFRNWHPVPGTMGINEANGGRGCNGGVWEWTSTLFDTYEGMVPTKIFLGFSEDFFDGKHHVVVGASHATIPRIAARRTVRNFWQHNYPYAWVGARVVYDI